MLAAASLLLVTLHALAAAALLVVLVLLGGNVVLEGRHGIKLRQLAHVDVLGLLPRRERADGQRVGWRCEDTALRSSLAVAGGGGGRGGER